MKSTKQLFPITADKQKYQRRLWHGRFVYSFLQM